VGDAFLIVWKTEIFDDEGESKTPKKKRASTKVGDTHEYLACPRGLPLGAAPSPSPRVAFPYTH
jgi:hypothetical protein